MPQRWHAIHARVLAGEELAQEEELVPRQDGGAVWARRSMKPWRTFDGRIGGGLVFLEVTSPEVTDRHAAAEDEARGQGKVAEASVGISHTRRHHTRDQAGNGH